MQPVSAYLTRSMEKVSFHCARVKPISHGAIISMGSMNLARHPIIILRMEMKNIFGFRRQARSNFSTCWRIRMKNEILLGQWHIKIVCVQEENSLSEN